MRFGFINNFAAQIAAPLTDTATEVELSTGADVIATLLGNADAVALTLFATDSQGNEAKREVVYATAATPPMVTIARAKEGSTAAAFTAGDGAEARLTAGMLEAFLQGVGGLTPASASGAVALGAAHEQNGEAFAAAQAVEVGAQAFGAGASATGSAAVALAGGVYAALSGGGALVLVAGAASNAPGAVAIGAGSQANSPLGVAIGDGSESGGVRSLALAGGGAFGTGTTAIGQGSVSYDDGTLALAGGSAYGQSTAAIGDGSASYGQSSLAVFGYASGIGALALGYGSQADGDSAIALLGSASIDESIAIGPGSSASAEGSIAIGRNTTVGSQKSTALSDGAQAQPPAATALGAGATVLSPEAIALGIEANAQPPYSVAIGRSATTNIVGGLALNALSYVPAVYNQTGEFAGPPPTATRQAAMQVVVATTALDLTDGTAFASVALPANVVLLPDAFDVVVVESDTPGGAPEIQIGPDDVTPAAYLAATPVTKTAVGGRETHTPLVTDGITALRVAVVTAGTGTAYKIKVVVRGYVMEV